MSPSCSVHGNVEDLLDSVNGDGVLRFIDCGTPALISGIVNRESDGDGLHVPRFCSRRLHWKLIELRDPTSIKCDTAAGVCIRRWKRWGHRGAVECKTLLPETDMPYVRRLHDAMYEHRLRELLASFLVGNAQSKMYEDCVQVRPSIQLAVLR